MVEFRSMYVGTARRQAAALGYALHWRGGLFALVDSATQHAVMGFGADGEPSALIDEVLEWLKDGGH